MSNELGKTERSKQRMRRRLADLPYPQKLQILDELRDQQFVRLPGDAKPSTSPTENQAKPKSLLLEFINHTVQRHPRSQETIAGSAAEKTLAVEVEAMFADRERAVEALAALFPQGVSANSTFYDQLNDLHLRLGWGELSHRAAGLLLVEATEQLGNDGAEALLRQVSAVRSPDFFQVLESLHVFVEERTLRAEFAAEWFPALVRRIGNDLASGGFWKALEVYCEKHSESAVQILRCLLGAKDDAEISVAANLLGTLRTLSLSNSAAAELAQLDATFLNNSVSSTRSVHHRSWIQTAWRGKMSRSNLAALLGLMSGGTPDEQDLAFWIACRSLLSPAIAPDAFDFGMDWLRANAKPLISANAKHHVVDFAAHLAHKGRWEGEDLLLSIQPIPVENKGTWQQLEAFLVHRLQTDVKAFSAYCLKLAEQNASSWLKVMQELRSFEWLISEMQGKDLGELVGWLVFSRDVGCRKLGLFLFDKLSLVSLPTEILNGVGEDRFRLAFYELQRTLALDGEAIARFLIVLIPGVQRTGQEFQREFYDELVLQIKNFGGSCRDEFKKRADEFPSLKRALDAADRYVEALRKVRESHVGAMEVSGYRQADRISRRRFANAVSQGAEQQSAFMKLFKKVHLLYGKQWSSFHDGKLSETFGLQQFSTDMEISRLERIDPEGMALRRCNAAAQIRDLSKSSEEHTERK